VILSDGAWRRYFSAAEDVVGKSLTLDGRSLAVVGVMPDGFRFPDPLTELWIPHVLAGPRGRVSPIARLADGVSRQTASAQVNVILGQFQAAASPGKAGTSTFEVRGVQEQLVAPIRPALTVLAIAAGTVLLIACVNVANLLLVRTVVRRREIAVRLALGAGRGRLARQLLTESMLLAIAGGAAGIGLAFGGLQLLQTLGASMSRADLTPGVSIPRLDEIAIDPFALIGALAVVVATTVLFGVAPALRPLRLRLTDNLRDGTSSAQAGFNLFRRHRLRGLLVMAQIAMAMLLLVAGGLMMRSFIKLSNVEPGYDPTNLLTFNVPAVGEVPPFFNDELVARLRTMPGVRSVGYAELMPMVRFRSGIPIKPVQPTPGVILRDPIDVRTVSRDFLPAMGVPVVAGRGFAETDGKDQPRVILVNRTLARSGFMGSNPIGAKVFAGPFQWEVVGIVDDVHQYGLDQHPDPQVFFDIRQLPAGNPSPYFAVRTDSDPAALVTSLRTIVRELNPAATVDNLATMEQVISNSMSRPRLVAVLAGIFAGVAGLLALVGIYGLIAYAAAERTREFGIRIALGATRGNVIRLVLGQSALLIAAGLVLGVGAAAAFTRHLQGLLFGLTPLDPATFTGMAVTFGMVATLASYLPGRRATQVDPLVALRND
jgi:putative ABC transport system permease protein